MAVLLDTNVVSELLRPSPDPVVESWVAECPAVELHFSAVGEAELRYGVAILPAGQRKDALTLAIEAILRGGLRGPHPAVRQPRRARVCGGRLRPACRRPLGGPGGLSDRGDRPLPWHGGGDAQRPGLRDIEVEVFNPWTAA